MSKKGRLSELTTEELIAEMVRRQIEGERHMGAQLSTIEARINKNSSVLLEHGDEIECRVSQADLDFYVTRADYADCVTRMSWWMISSILLSTVALGTALLFAGVF